MATNDDQPRPDLDAAIDAVVPSLTAVSDDAVAASLRRTRIALAEDAPVPAGFGAWRWGAAAIAMTVGLLFVSLRQPPPVEPPRVAIVEAPASPPRSVPTAAAPAAPERVASAEPAAPRPDRRRSLPVRAASTPSSEPAASPDPMIALVRTMQEIPEETWTEGLARSQAPLAVPDVPLAPIGVAPLETPAIIDTPAESVAPGEP